MPMMEQITKATFCAHDENETALQYVKAFKKWVLTDKRGLSIEFDQFNNGLINMSIITQTPIEKFTILGE